MPNDINNRNSDKVSGRMEALANHETATDSGHFNNPSASAPERGLRVAPGNHVFADGEDGICIAVTQQFCVFVDADGREHASPWDRVMVDAIGPAQPAQAPPRFHTLDANTVQLVLKDPLRTASLHLLDAAGLVRRLDVEFDDLQRDTLEVVEALCGAAAKLNEVSDNRAVRLLDVRREGGEG